MIGVDVKRVIKWETHGKYPNISLVPILDQLLEETTDRTDSILYLYYYNFVTGGL